MDIKVIISNLMKKYNLNFDETQTAVFINHLASFHDRLIRKQSVGLHLDDQLRNQISAKVWQRSQIFVIDFLTQMGIDKSVAIPEEEVFLVATHLSLL